MVDQYSGLGPGQWPQVQAELDAAKRKDKRLMIREMLMREGLAKGEARGLAKGEARGLAKGEARGLAKGRVIGQIQFCQKTLGVPVTPVRELGRLSLAELRQRARALGVQLRAASRK